MLKEEFERKITDIGSLEDVAEIRNKLIELRDEVNVDYDSFVSATKERDQFKTDNETLRAANMKLFLQVGGKKEPEGNPGEDESTNEDLKYEDLFDDKGGLK